MVKKVKEHKKNLGLLDLGLKLFLGILLIALIIYLAENIGVNPNKSFKDSTTVSNENARISPTPSPATNQFEWKAYESKEFGFSLKYPPSLSLNDLGNVGGYIDFIRFEEEPSLGLEDKGIALGVSTLTSDKQVEKIKDQIKKEGGAILVKEDEVEFKGFVATRLQYKPEDESINEERIILIVKGSGKYTYSISTVPEQVDKVIQGFEFHL